MLFVSLAKKLLLPIQVVHFSIIFLVRFSIIIYNYVYGTGIAVEIPEGYAGFLFPRSSISKYDLALTNGVGVLDSSYRGEIMAKFKPAIALSDEMEIGDSGIEEVPLRAYEVGDRIAQLIILPYPEIEFEQADELSDSDRGMGGYGSTGK